MTLPALSLTLYWYVSGISHSPVQEAAEVFFVRPALQRDFERDRAVAHQLRQRHVHRHHAEPAAGLEHRIDLVDLALTDEVPDGRRRHHYFTRDAATATVSRRQELLRANPLQCRRKLHAHLLLLVSREDVDHAVDRLRRVLSVQR